MVLNVNVRRVHFERGMRMVPSEIFELLRLDLFLFYLGTLWVHFYVSRIVNAVVFVYALTWNSLLDDEDLPPAFLS